MDLRQLKYFMTIAEEGQITSAARRLHIAQPPLSQQLKALETELNIQLFERTTTGIKITEAGRQLLQRSYELFDLVNTIEDELNSFRNGMEGVCNLGVVSSSGAVMLDQRFLDFHQTFPLVRFQLFEGNSFQIVEYLEKGLIEVGIIRTPFDSPRFAQICRPPTPMVAVARDQALLTSTNTMLKLSDLVDRPIIINRRYHKCLQAICNDEGYNLHYLCLNNDARTTLWWAQQGLGVGIVPKETLILSNTPDLLWREIDHPALFTQLCAIWDKNRPLSRIAKNFLNHCFE